MPSKSQYDYVKHKCQMFEELGYHTNVRVLSVAEQSAPAITITKNHKVYKFSDLNWDVVIKQLDKLFETVTLPIYLKRP